MKKGAFAVCFIALMVAMGVCSIAAYFCAHYLPPDTAGEVQPNVPVVQSYKDIYPFEEEAADVSDTAGSMVLQGLSNCLRAVKCAEAGIDNYTNSSNLLSGPFQLIAKWCDEAVRSDVFLDDERAIVRLSNGYYTFPYPYSRADESRQNLLDFTRWLQAQNIKFVHLIPADKGDDGFGTFPRGVPAGYGRMAEEYKSFLSDHGLCYLETKPRLLEHNSDFYYWFYKADHHWNVHAGLLVAEECAKKLNEVGVAANPEMAEKDRFTLRTYTDSFLGSQGRALGPWHTEDFEVYYPAAETDFRIEIPTLGLDLRGPFAETLIARQHLSYAERCYAAFMYGDQPLIRVENYRSGNDTRVLVLKASKADVVCPYLAFTVRHLDVIDPRHFDGSIRSFVEKTRPDVVVACIDVPYEGSEVLWELK